MKNSLFSGGYEAGFHGKRRGALLGMASVLLVCILGGCVWVIDNNGETMQSAIPLRLNTWATGELDVGEARWYQFTATAAVQYIHIAHGMVSRLYVQLHNSADSKIEDLYTYDQSSATYHCLSLSRGKKYYLKVSASDSVAYKIAFTESAQVTPDTAAAMARAATLSAGIWKTDTLAIGEDQWYKFTATAKTQYLHVVYGTLRDLRVQVYDSVGDELGTSYAFDKNGEYASVLINSGAVYYLKVWPYLSSGHGSYKIAFNTSTSPPPD